jgi:predicted dehydrogenase
MGMIPEKEIRIGVVGLGHLGNYHLQKYAKLPHNRIVGVMDTDRARALKVAGEFHCEAFRRHRDLIGKIDAASIAVPTGSHYAIARDFLEAGIDVLLEKPIAATREEAAQLVKIARAKKRILQIGFVERFNPAIVALGKVIREPLFIETHRLHPFFNRGTDVDVVLDLMIHDLDIILNFVKSPVKSVDAVGISVLSERFDIANARLVFRNGCVANITSSRVTNKKMQKIRFFGLEGYHSVDYEKRELVSLSRKTGPEGKVEIGLNNVEIIMQDPLEAEIAAFLNSILTRCAPAVAGEDALKSLKLALRILNKMNANQEEMLNVTHG